LNVPCPKCASIDALRVATLYDRAVTASETFPPVAAPPRKRHPVAWLAITVVFALMLVRDLSHAGLTTSALIVLTIGGAWIAQAAWFYNSHAYPELLSRWERSFICRSCGHVFPGLTVAGSHVRRERLREDSEAR
jgi:hypothetical protein